MPSAIQSNKAVNFTKARINNEKTNAQNTHFKVREIPLDLIHSIQLVPLAL
jgi:hypothetical protein